MAGDPGLKRVEGAGLWGVLVNPSPRPAPVSSMATTAATSAITANAGLASPHLTRRASNSSCSSPSPDHTSAHARRPPSPPRLASRLFLSERPNVRSELFLPVRPPSFGEEGERGRGKEWEVGERAHRPSVVVSWLRAAVVK